MNSNAFASLHLFVDGIIPSSCKKTTVPYFSNLTHEKLAFLIGAHRRKGTTDVQQEFNVKTLIVHKDFNKRSLRNDIALLELDRSAQLSEKVMTVCLPDKAPELNANCYITGAIFVSFSFRR